VGAGAILREVRIPLGYIGVHGTDPENDAEVFTPI
jgi:hypothetical protein